MYPKSDIIESIYDTLREIGPKVGNKNFTKPVKMWSWAILMKSEFESNPDSSDFIASLQYLIN